SDVGAQVIVQGKPIGNMNALRYTRYKSKLKTVIRGSFKRLSDKYQLVVLEGAGSPAEINLKSHDLVNLKMASYAKAPVILVGDIDKGGVFAWIVGTLELLTTKERKMIKGIIINKFRGDKRLLMPGIYYLEKKTGIKVLGVIPYYRNIKIPEEDAVPLDSFRDKKPGRQNRLNIAVIYLPHISNFTDFDGLEKEPDVRLNYLKSPEELSNPDLIIIPGTKNTISDLKYLYKSGFAKKILSILNSAALTQIVGICGGYQMLGSKIRDENGLESSCRQTRGLDILPVETSLKTNKILSQVKAKDLLSGLELTGYEIHHGRTRIAGNCQPAFEVFERNDKKTRYLEGAATNDRHVLGTYIHGIFDAEAFRRNFLNRLRRKKGWPVLTESGNFNLDKEFDKLAKLVRDNIDTDLLYKILAGGIK
ncbi:MAG: cobyric acid synthase, partial [Candidatus Omnitrophica bacterium]|nr:cobyric acid synthase [Candidatus Omnitrophota bacterium]